MENESKKLVTGVTTSDGFIEVFEEKGISINPKNTAEDLLNAIDLLDDTQNNITFKATNETVVEVVNDAEPEPEPEPTIVPWTEGTVSNVLIFNNFASVDQKTIDDVTAIIEDAGGIDECEITTSNETTVGYVELSVDAADFGISFNTSLGDDLIGKIDVSYTLDSSMFTMVSGTYTTVDGDVQDIKENNVVELPQDVYISASSGSTAESIKVILPLLKTYDE